MNRRWFIYGLVESGSIRYVGKTDNLQRRLLVHSNPRLRDKTQAGTWLRKLKSQGIAPLLIILQTGQGDWQIAEKNWIASFPKEQLYNHHAGGQGADLSGPNGEITRARIAAAARLRWADPKQRAKQSKTLKGRIVTPETRSRISKAVKKLWEIPGARAKLSAANKKSWADPKSGWRSKKVTAKHSASAKRQWANPSSAYNNPETRRKQSDGVKRAWKARRRKMA